MNASQTSQNIGTEGTQKLPFLDSLACPVCDYSNVSSIVHAEKLQCTQCETEFPLYKCGEQIIPWVFEQPNLNLLEWKARLNGFLHLNQQSQLKFKVALKDKRLSKTSLKRISKLLDAKKQQAEQVLELLSPLNFTENTEHLNNSIKALQTKVPSVQGLDSYYDNIFRDWCWDNGENQQLLDVVVNALGDHKILGKVLTIGAGAGRLSYDIHQLYSPEYSILLDINPLLLLSGCHAIQGNKFILNEFPIAPLNKDSFVAEQLCHAPAEGLKQNIYYMFADGMNPPFKAKSFDTILTPWLLDIIPQNLKDYIPRINEYLTIGGSWLNTGSLAFFHKNQAWCYSEEEVIELLEKNGFEILSAKRSTIQYMHSPLSAHGRTENVFTFHAKKIKDVVVPAKYEYLPDWIKTPSKAIPKLYEQEIVSSKHLLQAQVLGAIDGVRSIEQIGKLVAKQYNLQADEATHAVRRILLDNYEDN